MLTEEQQALFNYLNQPDTSTTVLDAPGGTGKTYFIKHLLNSNKHADIKVLAPTHKAAGLYKKSGIECETIHRFLSAERDINETTGDTYFKFKTPAEDYDLLVVDECSMISKDMYSELEKLMNVLYVGDRRQLPPIGEKLSEVFLNNHTIHTFTINKRINANPDSISAVYLSKFKDLVDNPEKKIQILNRASIEDVVNEFKNNNNTVVLGWTNSKVHSLNEQIRKSLFNTDTLEAFYPGEVLYFSGYRYISDSLKYYSSDEILVKKVKVTSLTLHYNRCPHQKIKFKTCDTCGSKGRRITFHNIKFYEIEDSNKVTWLKPFSDEDEKNLKSIIAHYKAFCIKKKDKHEWRLFYNFVDTYNPDIFYRYALTVHKSQGSQWKTVFVDINNIRLCRDQDLLAKLSYTAVSRFTDFVFFI